MAYRTNPSSGLLILLCSVQNILCICPMNCSCLGRNRNVDCSGRNLTALPHGLQDNITHLNLSHNHLSNLDYQLTRFTNLRSLDLSYNLFRNLPAHLPRSLWEVYAANNNIKVLHKLDTAYQWNLKVLDLSSNRLQRTVLINNTLSSMQLLNLSNNQLWTVPTNMPYNIQTVDLSSNSLIQILPGTLARLFKLKKLYLHNNRFTYIPNNAFNQLTHLQEITLYNNPWACKETQNMKYLLEWVRETTNSVKGYPCINKTSQHNIVQVSPMSAEPEEMEYDIPLFTTTSLLFLEAQETKLYTQLPFSETVTEVPLNTNNNLLESTDYPFFTDEGSAHEIINFDFNDFSNKNMPLINSKEVEDTEPYGSTVTLDSIKDMSNNVPEMTHSSTSISVVIQATTVKIKGHIPSSAHKDKCLASYSLLLLLVLRIV
ncbi:oligodendrocyte-myelin glycoprotein [Rhinophrynus dorsalis]